MVDPMVRHALWTMLLLASGCFEDRYRCATDEQCDIGEGGRCEVTGLCSTHDITCPTRQRYAAHAGELTDSCFDDRVVPVNACAGGQAPARPENCFASVCARVPACCSVAWTDACAQLAQESCDVRCDTRIAITATRGAITELWDARWTGTEWTFSQRTDLLSLAWVGPAPGTSVPRLAGSTASELVVGDLRIAVPADRTYNSISTVAFDRDGRETIAAGYVLSGGGHVVELSDPITLAVRETRLPGSQSLAWGDVNRDTFVDAVVKGGAQYTLLDNFEDATYTHRLSETARATVTGGQTPGAAQLRSLDWLDLNSDGHLDLVAFGNSIRVHTVPEGLTDASQREYDCDPPDRARACMDAAEPNLESVAFSGAALPTSTAPSLAVAVFPHRKIFRIHADHRVVQLPLPGDSCTCTSNCMMCPGPNCSCTYNCSACAPVHAIVARDLDGDRALDLVAIDARLQIFTALASSAYQFTAAAQVPTTVPNNFFGVDVSVTGAPIP